MGLRLREATTLQVKDILSDRELVHIHAGKGAQDRTIPLPKITLLALREYYKTQFLTFRLWQSKKDIPCPGPKWRQERSI